MQRPNEGIHALNTHITTLVNQCKFPDLCTKEKLKIMVLQHTVHYHEAQDWIHQQDQSQLTYQALLWQCQLLESCCKIFQKAKEKGHTELTSLRAATSSVSSIHPGCPLSLPQVLPVWLLPLHQQLSSPQPGVLQMWQSEPLHSPVPKKTPVIIPRKQSQVSQRCRHITPARMQH